MLKMIRVLLIPAIALAGLSACQRAGDQDIKDKLKSIDDRISSIEEAVKRGPPAGAARPGQPQAGQAPPQRPPGPDPDKVYAAPIEGAPFRGGEHAKVTIVEASTFT